MRNFNVRFFLVVVAFLVVLTAGLFLGHYFQSGRIARALLRQAEKAEALGRPDKTVRFLSRYLEFSPDDVEERAHLARLLAGEKFTATPAMRQRALFVLEQVLAREPNRKAERCLLMRIALDLNRMELIEGHAKYLQEFLAEDGEANYLIARWHEAREDFAEAADWYRQAIAHDPKQIDGYVRLAGILRHRLDPAQQEEHNKEADQLMNDLVARNEDVVQAHLARWHYRRERGGLGFVGKLAEAGQDVLRAFQLAPQDAEVLLAAAELAQAQDDLIKARDYLQTGMQLHRLDARFYRAAAQLELRAGRKKEAVALYAEGAKAVPGQARSHLLWDQANLLIDLGYDQETAQVIDQIQQGDPPPGAVDYLLARLHLSKEKWSAAAQGFERVRPLFEASADLVQQVDLYLGQCYEQLGEPASQLAVFGRALARDPSSLPARLGSAAAQTALGRSEEALEQYRQAMKLPGAPASGWIDIARLALLANGQKGQTNWKEVEEALDRAEKAEPGAVEVPLLRAEALAAQGRLAQAHEMLVQARDRKPKQVEIWSALATLAEKQGKWEEAAQILDQAAEQTGDQVGLRLARARWCVGRRDPKAAEVLNQLAEHLENFSSKDQVVLLRGLAAAQQQAGHVAEARSLWSRLAALPEAANDLPLRLLLFELALQAGDEPAMNRLLGEMQRMEGPQGPVNNFCQALWLIQQAQQGNKEVTDKAQALLDLVASQRPTWPAVPLARADLEELRGQQDQVIVNFRRAIELGERHPRVLRRLVELLYQQQRFDEADQEIRKLQQQAPLATDLQRLAVAVSLQNQDQARAIQLALSTVARDSKDYRDYLWLGRVLATANGSTAEAEKQLRRAVELADDVPETWLALVQFLATVNRKDAEKVIDQARSRLPKDKAALALGQCYEAVGQQDKADHEYKVALSVQPEAAPVLRTVASYYLRAGRAAEAEALLRDEKHLAKATSDERAWARRQLALILANRGECQQALALTGLSLDQQGQVIEDKLPAEGEVVDELRSRAQLLAIFNSRSGRAKAIAYLEELSRRQPLTSEDQVLLAHILESDGSWPKARAPLRNLVTAQNPDPRFLAFFAGSLLRHQELDEAAGWIDQLEKMEKAKHVESGTFGSLELRAQLLEARGEGRQALSLLQAKADSKRNDPESLIMLVSALARQKRWQEALDLCQRAWSWCPPEMLGGLSVAVLRAAHVNEEQCKQVEDRLRAAIDQNPKATNLTLQLADLLEFRGRSDVAEAEYRRVLEQDNRNVRALNNLAWLLAQKPGKETEALTLINQAIEVAGPKTDLLDTRATAYLAMKETAAAIADLQTAIADAPSAFRYFHLAHAQLLAHNREAAEEAFRQAEASGLVLEELHPAERVVYRQMSREFEVK